MMVGCRVDIVQKSRTSPLSGSRSGGGLRIQRYLGLTSGVFRIKKKKFLVRNGFRHNSLIDHGTGRSLSSTY